MDQKVKVIDVTKTFMVTDPNAFPNNQGYTQQEDNPEKGLPILGFEGYNFLPTSYGYRSYFGQSSILNVPPLLEKCDRILLYQFANYTNILVALTQTGIYLTRPSIGGSLWVDTTNTPIVYHDWLGGRGFIAPADLATPITYLEWTFCVLENILYMYKEGTNSVYTIGPAGINLGTGVVTVGSFTPTFLNMAGQKGIFRAGGRLGFWDSANSVSWSDQAVKSDFTPAIETRAGNMIFKAVLGRIVTIKEQGDGFVIYTTKGIVGVRFINDISMLWEATAISDTAGIAYDREVTTGITDLEHFAYTNTGIKRIGSFSAINRSHQFEDIIPDIYDLLKEQREPVYLDFLNGRYLFLSVINSNYIYSKTSFVYNTINAVSVRLLVNDAPWNGVTVLPVHINGTVVSAHIAAQMLAGVTTGMYTEWIGQGRTMYPTWMNSPMNPYAQDSSSNHVPNASIRPGPTFVFSGTAESSLIEIGLASCIPDNAINPVGKYLGWSYPGLNNTGSAFKGLADSYLADFIATQIAEWDNFTAIQVANKTAIESIPPYSAPTVQGNTPYLTSAAAQAVIDAIIVANGGSGNSYQVSNTLIGSFLSGAGTINNQGITGAGTNYAQLHIDKTFTGGYDVYRKKVRTYSIRSATRPVNGVGYVSLAGTMTPLGSWSVPPPSVPLTSCFAEGATSAQALNTLHAAIVAQYPAAFQAIDTGNFTYNASNPVWPGNQGSLTYTVSFPQVSPFPFVGSGYNLISSPNIYGVGSITEYFIDYVDTTTIPPLTTNPTITLTSAMMANQIILNWAYIGQGLPEGNFTSALGAIDIPGTNIVGTTNLPLDLNIVYPGASFLINDGSPAPIYPTFSGALVLDTALKKWGKMKGDFRTIMDMAPINSIDSSINFTNFGLNMAMLSPGGEVRALDARPTDSWIRYGKVGYYRQGYTQCQEVRASFRSSSSGNIILDTSIDGRALELSLNASYPFSSAADVTAFFSNKGRWHTITVSGQFDLQYLEFRGNSAGRR